MTTLNELLSQPNSPFSLENLAAAQINEVKQSWKRKLDKIQDCPVIDMPSKRRLQQPKFRHLLESEQDFNLRVQRTVIHVGTVPYYVEQVWHAYDEFWLIVMDEHQNRFKIPYHHPAVDLRNPEPQYLQLDGGPAFLYRRPVREQPQGLHAKNYTLKDVGTENIRSTSSILPVIAGLKATDTTVWSPAYADLMHNRIFRSIRLSPQVSVYRDDGQICVEYRGRPLGPLTENSITVDSDDFERPWIKRDLTPVGLVTRVA
jgi:hypothetical protein